MSDSMSHRPTPELLTPQELADRLRLSVAHVLQMARAGRIPSLRCGHRTIRFDLAEVIEALRSPEGSCGQRRRAKTSHRPPAPVRQPELRRFDWKKHS